MLPWTKCFGTSSKHRGKVEGDRPFPKSILKWSVAEPDLGLEEDVEADKEEVKEGQDDQYVCIRGTSKSTNFTTGILFLEWDETAEVYDT